VSASRVLLMSGVDGSGTKISHGINLLSNRV
jgi:hypothetical protein